jgi:signal transduction histidine kinase/DNA-binding response OmpR family regulator
VILGRPAPPGHVVVLHSYADRAEAVARLLRSAGHRASVIAPGPRATSAAAEALPDLILGSLSFREPSLGAVVRSLRQVLGAELPVLVLVSREEQKLLVGDDPEAIVDADDLIREPVDGGELSLRVSVLLLAQARRRQLERRVQELLGLYKISWGFSLAGGATALCGGLARESADLFGAEKGVVLLFDPERRQMYAQEPGQGLSPEQVQSVRYAVDGEARERWNFLKNGPLLSNNARADSRLLPEVVQGLGLNTVIVAPMAKGARVLGLLVVADRAGAAPFTDDDLNLLQAVAGQAAAAVENLLLHEELKRVNSQLQEYDRLKSEFVAMVAHDFRKPLTAIRGFAELVLEEPDLAADERKEFMRTVISETDALAALANETLLITRIETGEFTFQWTALDLGPLVLNAIPLGLSKHSVLMDVPAPFPKITADADRLRHVLSNLIGNAVKYSPEGGNIIVRCRERGGDHVAVEVQDHGLGIPADQVGSLFQKFQRVRTPEHLRIAGTGLGLYICRLIVEGHGGRIWVESEPGKGSTFGFVLPREGKHAARTMSDSPAKS